MSEFTAEGGHGAVPTAGVPSGEGVRRRDWPLWEVFVRPRRGLSHQHVGSLHAPDAPMALRNNESMIVMQVKAVAITSSEGARVSSPSP